MTDNYWQENVSNPDFEWSAPGASGGATDGGSGVKGYHIYWGQDPTSITATTFITATAFDPAAVPQGKYYLRIQTEDNVGNRAAWETAFTFKYVAEQSPTFYYDNTANGTLTVTLVGTDIPAGLNVITYPNVFATDDGNSESLGGQQGPLTLTYEYEVEGTSAVSDTFSVAVTDTDLHNAASVDFNVVQDTEDPTVTIAVPAVAGLGIPVSWAGEDDLSGIGSYQVWVKENSDDWEEWLTETTATQGTYVGTAGYTYTFQVQATDNVGNVSGWVESEAVVVKGVVKYYSFGSQRIAMRRGDEVYYLSGDHLGSVSLATDSAGNVEAESRYLPYGSLRWTNGASVTDFGFTSQRHEGFGLYDYNARYYSPYLNRFVSPDSIVPEPGISQDFNRYTYTRNNPLSLNFAH